MTEEKSHSELPPSSADKWFFCHGWRRMVAGIEDQPSEAAELGTRAHSWLADHLLGIGQIENCPDPEMYDYLSSCIAWVEDQPGALHVEQSVDYGAPFGYVDLTGTADIILEAVDHLTIGDLKYGFGLVEVEYNLQLLIYLWGAVQKYGARPQYQIVILQPRAWHKDGPIRPFWISHEDLIKFSRDLEKAIAANYHPRSKPTVGDYCRKFCRAFGRCPAAAAHSLSLFQEHPIE